MLLMLLGESQLQANHLTGGEMRYTYLNTLANGRQVYRITVEIYRDDLSGGAGFDNPLYMTVFNMDNTSSKNIRPSLSSSNVRVLPLNDLGPCAKGVPNVRIQKATYTILDTVTVNNNGYVYSHQRCCRSDAISNLSVPGDQGSTYSVHLTRNAMLANNSNPTYNQDPPLLVCLQSNFRYQFAATDANGHRLRYYLCEPHLGGHNFSNSGIRPTTSSSPPYNPVRYLNGYSATEPFGSNVEVELDPNTGLLTMKPDRVGVFTIAVCIEEFDNNNRSLGFTKRDIQFNIADCIVPTAVIIPPLGATKHDDGSYSVCKGLVNTFNNSSIDAQTYFWDFGVEGITSDTSILKNPVFAYSDSGTYNVQLVINKGQTCSDSITFKLSVYPTLEADFDYTALCESLPVEFKSTSTSTVDPIVKNTWWQNTNILSEKEEFGHIFPAIGPYPVKLVVETKNGCRDTIVKNVTLPDFTKADFSSPGIRQGQTENYLLCSNSLGVTFVNQMPQTVPFIWKIGNATSSQYSPTHIFADTGTYQIQLIANPNTSCADTATKWIRIIPDPVADFVFISDCKQFPVEFSSAVNRPYDPVSSAIWNYGDGTTSTDLNPDKKYTNTGNYNVRYSIVTVGGCTDTITKPVTVFADPVADFDMKGEKHNTNFLLCDQLLPIVFEPNAINAQSYTWNFGPGLGTTGSFTSMFVFPDTGTYQVQLIINRGQRCTDTIVKPVRLIDGISRTDFTTRDVCVNVQQTFTNQSVAVKNDFKSYLWDFGDGTASTLRSPQKTYNQPGTYTVKLIVETNLGCRDSLSKTVVIYPAPVMNFVNDDACLNAAKVFSNTSSVSSGTIDTYLWTFGNLGTASDQNPQFTFQNAGNVNVVLRGTSDMGCVATVTKPVRIRPAAIVDFEYNNHCYKAPVYFKELAVSPNNDIVQWNWTFAPGVTATGKEVDHVFATPGNHTVKLVVVTSFGCKDSVSKVINIKNVPDASYNITGNSASSVTLFSCSANLSATFNNTSPSGLNYLWDFGIAGATSTDEDPIFVYPDSGTYVVKLITEPGTACQDEIQKTVRILPSVTASYTFTTECVKAPVFFNADTDRPFDPIKTIVWNFADGTTSGLKEPEKMYATSGNKNVRLTLTAESGCRATVVRSVPVAAAPIANFVPEGVVSPNGEFLKCEELLGVRFRNTSSGSQINFWEFSDLNKTSTDVSPVNIFSQTGEYPVTLYINRGKICSDSIQKQVTVIDGIESVDFEFDNACVNTEIQFTEKSKAVLNDINSYFWDFGDNTTSLTRNPKKSYAQPGDYKVKLYVRTTRGCVDSLEQSISIYPAPQSLFDVTLACLNEQVHIDNHSTISSGSITTHFWTFGNQMTSPDISPDITYSTSGFYPVTLTTTSDLGCTHTKRDTIEIRIPSQPDFTYVNQCVSALVEFADMTQSAYNDIVSWEWKVAGNVTLTGRAPSYQYTQAGDYDVRLLVTTGLGCKDSIVKTITLKPHPVADFVVDGIETGTDFFVKCDDSRSVSFLNESVDNLTNLWGFDMHGSSADISPSFVFPDTGLFKISLVVNDGTLCRDVKEVQINVLPGLYVDFSNTLVCQKNEVVFTDLSSTILNDIVRRDWTTGDENVYTGKVVSHIYEKSGNYNVKLIVETARGCLDTLKKIVTASPLPIVDFNLSEVCPGKRTRFPNSSTPANIIQSYFWDFGNGTTSTDRLPYVTYDVPGTYDVKLKAVTQAGCSDSITDIVLVRDYIEPDIVQSQSIFCEDRFIVFDGSGSKGIYQDYLWEFGDGQSADRMIDSVQYGSGGEYKITLTLKDALCGEVSATSLIEIIPVPVINLGDNFALCPNLTTELRIGNSLTLDSIIWSTGATDVPQITIDGNAGTVSVEIFHKGCYNSDTIYITPSCDVLAPKAFSPNGDGVNDLFNVLPPNVHSYQLFVYNRWGKEIFTTNDLKKGWDGKYNGEDAPMDSYTYYAVGVKTDGTNFTIQGAVLLVR